jgi:hypothetical protein
MHIILLCVQKNTIISVQGRIQEFKKGGYINLLLKFRHACWSADAGTNKEPVSRMDQQKGGSFEPNEPPLDPPLV